MKSNNMNKRIGEQGLMNDSLLLDWFPKDCKEISDMQAVSRAATNSFLQRGSSKY